MEELDWLYDDGSSWDLSTDPFGLLADPNFQAKQLSTLRNSVTPILTHEDLTSFDDSEFSDLFNWDIDLHDTSHLDITAATQNVASTLDFPGHSATPILTLEDHRIENIEKQEHHPISTVQRRKCSKQKKWEESVVVFSSKPGEKIVSRKRKKYEPARRKEVAVHRLIGACIQCKIRKSSVSPLFAFHKMVN